jgi:hypothetical protein
MTSDKVVATVVLATPKFREGGSTVEREQPKRRHQHLYGVTALTEEVVQPEITSF